MGMSTRAGRGGANKYFYQCPAPYRPSQYTRALPAGYKTITAHNI